MIWYCMCYNSTNIHRAALISPLYIYITVLLYRIGLIKIICMLIIWYRTIIAEVGTSKKTISLSQAGGIAGGGLFWEPINAIVYSDIPSTYIHTIHIYIPYIPYIPYVPYILYMYANAEKYLTRGIFFKFVRDVYGIYGGDHFSMKAAGKQHFHVPTLHTVPSSPQHVHIQITPLFLFHYHYVMM